MAPPALRVRATGRPLVNLSGQAAASLRLVKTGGEAFASACHDGVRFLLFVWSVLAVTCFGDRSADPVKGLRTFSSEKLRLKLARGIGSGKRLFLTMPCGSLKSSHTTPWASGSSAACLAHSSAFSLPSIPWQLGLHRISMQTPGSLARRAAMCFLAMIAYFWPGPGSSDVFRLRVREDGDCSEGVAPGCCCPASPRNRSALCVVCPLAQSIWALWPFQVVPFFQVTA